MKEVTATLDPAGRLVVPATFRRALGVGPGSRLVLRLDDEGLHLLTPAQALAHAQALVRRHVPEGVSLSDELITERREESRRE